MISPRLVMIHASAGTGKTFRLTNRFIALLAAGAAPERIVALTFTRKAAGEFFDGILGKLAQAAASEERAAALARDVGRPELRAADFLRLLRAMVDALHRLRLGTLDSFFAKIAQAFPFELGLAGDFEVIEGHAAARERERVLRQLFASGGALDDAQRDFLEAFKLATFGTEEKQLARRMDKFLDEKYERFLEVPAPVHWGVAGVIWKTGQPWLDEVAPAVASAALRRWLGGGAEMTDEQRARWTRFATELGEWSVGAPWGDEMAYFLPKLLAVAGALDGIGAVLTIERKKQTLDVAGGAALREVVRAVAGGELRKQLAMTRGLHAVLARYDAVYSALVRRAGKLTFGDVTRLLRPDAGARALSFGAADEEGRLMLDYRLDAGIDHWLLDEFQDTSRGQWSVLQNLIDEVVQDPEERRTFFCVGDVKQSIYGWREGDPTLMGDIRRHYNGGDDATAPIATEPLDASWRSGPEVIAMVNAVFGASEVIAELFPEETSRRWTRAWREHRTERGDRAGQAAWLFAEDDAERHATTLRLIREIDPLARGLTCAVLTRSNRQAAEIADYLRREGGVPAVAESDLQVATDNPLGAALLALVQAATHPGDTLAWEHVRMTPLHAALTAEGAGDREAATARVLAQIAADGFERFAEHWSARVAPAGDFTRERARQFAGAAALFDVQGRRDPDEFVRFMQEYTAREPESAEVVRVMTIHKSKGLGFDVVIIPELEGTKLAASPRGLVVARDDAHEPEWVLELPKSELVEADPVLSRHAERAAGATCYEALSLLYVAMTRAKRAMYAITAPVAAKSRSHNYPKLLAETLGGDAGAVRVGGAELSGAWVVGAADWFSGIGREADEASAPAITALAAPAVPRRVARRPSGERAGERSAARLFARDEREAVTFGAEVHALLAGVVWCASDEIEARAAAWQAGGASDAAISEVVGCLRAPALRELWTRTAGAEVWRERSFEVVLDGAWVSGVFDRVVVVRGPDGRVAAATVFDFKTDRISGEAAEVERAVARHVVQLNLYRRVVARLAGLPESVVGAEVVFTALARRISVPAAS
ncbi:MAG: UvrD-helicase domain-containing protein [Candidatus Didemnitutus sp.]|nr:UvrD-helicase domain-containing protein [Candidatus Didemnitutus sp.]